MDKLELTQEELDAKIRDAVSKAVADKESELIAKHNSDMANLRTKQKAEQEKAIKDAVENANLSAEEKAKKESAEKIEAMERENAELKAYKHQAEIKDALIKEKMPIFLSNDSRLVNATSEEELNKAIASVKADYESSLPQGASVDTNVASSNGNDDTKKADSELERARNLGLH